MPVPVYVNPSTPDLDAASVEAAMRVALDEWTFNSGSRFEYVYAGRSNDSNTTQDGRNVILFRNTSNGSAIATTYAWWSGTERLDSDIVFWDASYTFFSGTTGCGGSGAYIEDIAAHELGHALGLHHSTAADATMYPSYRYCSQHMRSLAADDIAGAQAIYGSSSSSPNSAPAVSIESPANSSSFAEGTTIAFSGTAYDSQDGNLTAQLSWTSSIDGAIGAGGSRVRLRGSVRVQTDRYHDHDDRPCASATCSGRSRIVCERLQGQGTPEGAAAMERTVVGLGRDSPQPEHRPDDLERWRRDRPDRPERQGDVPLQGV
jgi:hypothetical protein